MPPGDASHFRMASPFQAMPSESLITISRSGAFPSLLGCSPFVLGVFGGLPVSSPLRYRVLCFFSFLFPFLSVGRSLSACLLSPSSLFLSLLFLFLLSSCSLSPFLGRSRAPRPPTPWFAFPAALCLELCLR